MARRLVELRDHGIGITLPRGWSGEVYLRADGGSGLHGASTPQPILHAANFALPAVRGDYGGGAVDVMRASGILLCLLEFDRAEATAQIFSAPGVPRRLGVLDPSPANLQRTRPGQAGFQRFCHESGRAFCLYVVIGSHARRDVLVPELNRALGTLVVE